MEKTQILAAGIEGFDSTKLRHTETNEKNPLPDKDGELSECFSLIWAVAAVFFTNENWHNVKQSEI